MFKKNEHNPLEWREIKRKAREDLDTRMALGMPHTSKPLGAVATVRTDSKKPAAKKTA